jgi:DNA-binding CsgD family transcriptional regulator
MSFNSICQTLIDAWLETLLDENSAEKVYQGVIGSLTVRMRLSVIDITPAEPEEWVLKPVKHTGVSSRIIDLNGLFRGGKLGDIKDQGYINTSVLPVYTKAICARQPLIDTVEARLLGIRVIYDRIILPEKAAQPRWLVVCTNGRFMAGAPTQGLDVDATDQAILTALIEGMTAKEIATEVGLSPRTVEHRLERAKKQMGARSLPHLAAMVVTAGFDRSIRHAKE